MQVDKNIVLIGMPGSGKSTVGRLLADVLNTTYIDTDDMVETQANMTISSIFHKFGEPHFRALESEAAERAGAMDNMVIATGGGMILKAYNMDALKKKGTVFFLDRPLDHIFSDVDDETRPLLKDNRDHLYNLYDKRYDLYVKYADYHIMNNRPVEEVVAEIQEIWMRGV